MDSKVRAWWHHRQALCGRLQGKSASEILNETGWVRSVGGANPYITLFNRGGIRKDAAEQATKQLEIHELPCARGCAYTVPNRDFAIALLVGQGFTFETEFAIASKYLGVTEKELSNLEGLVLAALKGKELDPKELKDVLGDAVRNLGAEGKKRGQTTTLPLALGHLQSLGQIRRVPKGGRLDVQRYGYTIWEKSPLENCKMTSEEAFVEMARRYFSWIGPATMANFQWFSGLGVGATKSILTELDLVPIAHESPFLIVADLKKEFDTFQDPNAAQIAFVSSLDGISLHRRDLSSLIDELDVPKLVRDDKKAGGGLQDLPANGIFDRGRLIGLWEYDTEAFEIVAKLFVQESAAIEDKRKEMEGFIRDELGDCRSFSLDSPESRKPLIAWLRS